jgi:RND superfamily putative drug exporter
MEMGIVLGIAVLLDALLGRLMLMPILLPLTCRAYLVAAEVARPARPRNVRFGH